MRALIEEDISEASPFIQHLHKLFQEYNADELKLFQEKLRSLPDGSLKRSISLLADSVMGMALMRK